MKYKLLTLGIQVPIPNAPNLSLSSFKTSLWLCQHLGEEGISEHASGILFLCNFPPCFRVHIKYHLIFDTFFWISMTMFSCQPPWPFDCYLPCSLMVSMPYISTGAGNTSVSKAKKQKYLFSGSLHCNVVRKTINIIHHKLYILERDNGCGNNKAGGRRG